MRTQRRSGWQDRARRFVPVAGLILLAWTVWRILWFDRQEPFQPSLPVPRHLLHAGFDTVILDPGHGGNDSGACAHGLQEKTVTLDLAQRLSVELRSRGLTVVLTRENDAYLSLTDRVRFARTVPDAIFISLHCNYAQEASAHGFEVYHAQTKAAEVPSLVLTSSGPEPLPLSEMQLASAIADSFGSDLRCDRHETRAADFFVLRNLDIPALLIECGFLTNPEDAKTLADPVRRTKLVDAIAHGIIAYRARVSPKAFEGAQSLVNGPEPGRETL